ncbi:MAG: alpha/beta fold hydrolase [Polyangiaceae bacterium]
MIPASIARVDTKKEASPTSRRAAALHLVTAPAEAVPARPVWFGDEGAALFGWFHPAAGDTPADAVVVMCSPFGYDALSTYFAHKKLAEHIALGGVATFRFDYYGTGDSAGDDEGPNRVETWLGDIGRAVEEAKRVSGASKVFLFGVRLGAVLATTYAQRAPVEGLIALGPSRSGAVFVREMLALNKMRAAMPNDGASPDIVFSDDEVLGFPFSAALRAEISALDPRKSSERPAARALVIARDDLPGPEKLIIEHLRSTGVVVAHSTSRGYSTLFADSLPLPTTTADEIVTWIQSSPLGRLPAAVAAKARTGESTRTAAVDGVHEESVFMGGLFGVWTEPPTDVARRNTAILLLGAGSNHRVGINRMHTPFARRLAKRGFPVLRFDLSGVGDSPTLPGERDRCIYMPQAVPETRAAIDYAMTRGVKQVAMAGLCSGGYTSFHTAAIDARVVAIAPINVPVYHFNKGDSLVLARHRPAVPWRGAPIRVPVSYAWRRAGVTFSGPSLFLSPSTVKPSVLPRSGALAEDLDDVARAFGGIAARGGKVLIVYGSGDSGRADLEKYLGTDLEKARCEPAIRVAIIDGADHTLTPRISQRRAHDAIAEFFEPLP